MHSASHLSESDIRHSGIKNRVATWSRRSKWDVPCSPSSKETGAPGAVAQATERRDQCPSASMSTLPQGAHRLTFCDPDVELLSEPRLKELLIFLTEPMSQL